MIYKRSAEIEYNLLTYITRTQALESLFRFLVRTPLSVQKPRCSILEREIKSELIKHGSKASAPAQGARIQARQSSHLQRHSHQALKGTQI